MAKPSTRKLVEATGISRTYAFDIVKGKQSPSRPLAIYIYRKLNWRTDPLTGLTDEQIDVLEAVEPWERATC